MSAPDPRMRWWGWGVDRDATSLPDKAREMLRQAFGVDDEPSPPVGLDEVELPDPALPDDVRAELAGVVGEDAVREDRLARVSHALGKSYPDLVRIRRGDASSAPDAVVYPASHDEVQALLELCSARRVAVTPFGGGSSVVGGVEPRRDGLAAAITPRPRAHGRARRGGPRLAHRDARARLHRPARRGAARGRGPDARPLPAVVGVRDARRLRGDAVGRPRLDRLRADRRARPRAAARRRPPARSTCRRCPRAPPGPDLRGLLVGSEGTLGVITQATLAVRPQPAVKLNEGWVFDSWQAGCEAFRAMEQAGDAADVCRLSDETETALNAAASGHEAPGPCLAVVGWEGEEADVARRAERTRAHLERAGARPLGEEAGARAGRNYFAGPYLRDELLGMGVLVETLETATTWSRLQELYARRRRRPARRARGARDRRARDVPRLAPVPLGRVALLLVLRAPGARRGARAVARGEVGRVRRDREPRRHDHAPPRDRARPRAVDALRRSASWGSRRCGRSSSSSTPPGS